MKGKKLVLLLTFLCIFSSSILKCQASSIVGNEYRFVETYNSWLKINGGDKINRYIEYSYKYKVLSYDNDSITVELTRSGFTVIIYNFTLMNNFYTAPIGFTFISPALFDYYYDAWVNTENIFEVNFAAYVGYNHSKDIRTASNYVFEGDFEGLISNATLGFEYDQVEEEFISIYGEEFSQATLLVQYDSDGVLMKIESEITITSSLNEEFSEYKLERVTEFTEPQTAKYFAIVGMISILLISIISKNKKRKRDKKKT